MAIKLIDKNADSLSRCKGRFWVSGEVLEKLVGDEKEGQARLLGLFSAMVVIRCEFIYVHRVFEYMAYSPLFRPVPEGEKVPTYSMEWVEDKWVAKEIAR